MPMPTPRGLSKQALCHDGGCLRVLSDCSGRFTARFSGRLISREHTAISDYLAPSPRSVFKRDRTACNVVRGTVHSFFERRALVSIVRI
jgi:hypothetical protein